MTDFIVRAFRRVIGRRADAPVPTPAYAPAVPSAPRTTRIRPYALAALERNHRRLTGARAFAGSLQLGGAHPRGRGVLAGVGR